MRAGAYRVEGEVGVDGDGHGRWKGVEDLRTGTGGGG